MKKLIKRFSVDCTQFVDDIVNGRIAYLGGLTLSSLHDEKTMIFTFIAAFIRKFPLRSGPLVTALVDMIPCARFGMLPVLLEPVEAGLHAGVLPLGPIQTLYALTIEILEKFTISDDDEVCACIEILSTIGKTNPDILNISALLNLVGRLLRVHTDEGQQEDEAEEDFSESSAISAIIRFVCEIYTSSVFKPVVNLALLHTVIKDLAISGRGFGEIMPLVLKMLNDGDRFKGIRFPILVLVTDVLMGSNQDLGLELVTDMKNSLHKFLQVDPSFRDQIIRGFHGSRKKQTEFAKLCKKS
jgi:hypothetical protein